MMLFAAVLAQLADMVTFILMGGLAYELNPIPHMLGFELAIVLKILLIAGLVAMTRIFSATRKYESVGVGVNSFACLMGTIGAISNILVMLL